MKRAEKMQLAADLNDILTEFWPDDERAVGSAIECILRRVGSGTSAVDDTCPAITEAAASTGHYRRCVLSEGHEVDHEFGPLRSRYIEREQRAANGPSPDPEPRRCQNCNAVCAVDEVHGVCECPTWCISGESEPTPEPSDDRPTEGLSVGAAPPAAGSVIGVDWATPGSDRTLFTMPCPVCGVTISHACRTADDTGTAAKKLTVCPCGRVHSSLLSCEEAAAKGYPLEPGHDVPPGPGTTEIVAFPEAVYNAANEVRERFATKGGDILNEFITDMVAFLWERFGSTGSAPPGWDGSIAATAIFHLERIVRWVERGDGEESPNVARYVSELQDAQRFLATHDTHPATDTEPVDQGGKG